MYWGHEEREEICTMHVAFKHEAGNDIIDSGLQYIACYHRGSVSQTCSLSYLPGSWYICTGCKMYDITMLISVYDPARILKAFWCKDFDLLFGGVVDNH